MNSKFQSGLIRRSDAMNALLKQDKLTKSVALRVILQLPDANETETKGECRMCQHQIPEPRLTPPEPEPGMVCIDCGDELQELGLVFPEGPVCRDCLGPYITSHYNVYDLSCLLHVPILEPGRRYRWGT